MVQPDFFFSSASFPEQSAAAVSAVISSLKSPTLPPTTAAILN